MPDVTLWHATRADASLSGVGRYERVLADADPAGWATDSVFRRPGRVRGSTPVSWFMDYRRRGGDLIHATAATAALPALVRRSAPLVVSSHGPIPVRYPEVRSDAITGFQWRAQPWVLDRADAVVANSGFTSGELQDCYGISPEKITVVPLGVDLDRFRPSGFEQFAPVDPDILILSSNLPQKRMDLARTVLERLPDLSVVKAGYGDALDGLANVTNVGWVPERSMPALYDSADVLFHPSEYESFGLPLLEAMACGTPVVAQDRTAMPEVVGDGGVLVDGEVDSFVAALRRVLDGGASVAPRQQAERFPWDRTVRETVGVWDSVT